MRPLRATEIWGAPGLLVSATNTLFQPTPPAAVSPTNRTRLGKYSKKTLGLISLSTLAATTPYSISRNAWLLRGTPSTSTQSVAAQQRTARPMTGLSIRSSVTPHACRATHSLSPENRPNATSRPSSRPMGMVTARADGTRRSSIRPTTGIDTPLPRRASASRSMVCIISMKVKMVRASANGGRISRSV